MKINHQFRRAVEINVGMPTMPSEEWETFVIKFHDFNNLPKNKWDKSPKFTSYGVEFSLHLYRSLDSYIDNTKLALKCHSEGDGITIEVKLCVQDTSGNIAYKKSGVFAFDVKYDSWRKIGSLTLGSFPAFVLDGGTFSFQFMMLPVGGFVNTFLPKNEISMDMSRLIWDAQFADVLFEVQVEETALSDVGTGDGIMGTATEKGKETALSKSIAADGSGKEKSFDNQLYAHRLILQVRAPGLAMFCEPYRDMTPVPIHGVDFLTFNLALKYVYGVGIPFNYWLTHSKKLIDVADRYALTNLKIEAEAWFVKLTEITISNAIDLLLYADAKNCPLLKEEVMKYFVKNRVEALRVLSFEDIPDSKSLFTDLLAAMSLESQDNGGKNNDGNDDNPSRFKTMDISSLRWEASARGLEIDGSRESLIKSLEQEDD